MTQSDLPELLRHLGGQPYYGEKVHHTLTESQWKRIEPLLLERLMEREQKESA